MSVANMHRTGSFVGTGSAITLDGDKIGFRPRYVRIVNVTGLVTLEWFDNMADDVGLKAVNDGTTQLSMLTKDGVTPTATGFTVGADADVNADGEVCHYQVLG